MDVLAGFQWWDASLLAAAAKSYGGVFAVVQMVHLLSLALLGGAVLVSDCRLLGWMLADVSSEEVCRQTDRLFNWALVFIVMSGVFMSGAVALKLYYNEMYWAKMAGLGFGIAFVYGVRRPLLRFEHANIRPATLRTMATASLVLWVSVAACGRWIGFS